MGCGPSFERESHERKVRSDAINDLGGEPFERPEDEQRLRPKQNQDRKSTRLNSSHGYISYAVFCLKQKTRQLTLGVRTLHGRAVYAFLRLAAADPGRPPAPPARGAPRSDHLTHPNGLAPPPRPRAD